MTEKQIKLIIGCLLHDIGKVTAHDNNVRNHSQSGYDYLKNEIGIQDPDILHCVLFHHGTNLKNVSLENCNNAYLTYFADGVAASADRREFSDTEEDFNKQTPLASIFNILNKNQENLHFPRQILGTGRGINYPIDGPISIDECFYQKITENISDNLKSLSLTEGYINSLLSVLEANLSYIPSSTSKKELADVSLYDHVKMTAATAQCVDLYLCQKECTNYKQALVNNAEQSHNEKMFLLYSMDISGIQNFIYTIASKGALKTLRARSFYLEILMEHVIDELLTRLSLSRANLLYVGGGHCYMLLPNIELVKETIAEQEKNINSWFLERFGTALYIAGGYAACSANDLKNEPQGSYSELYRTISKVISVKKMHRYTAAEIKKLNKNDHEGEHECKVCRRISTIDSEKRCPICAALHKLSERILKQDYFTITNSFEKDALPLPGNRFLVADTEKTLCSRMEKPSYVRAYAKNKLYAGKYTATKLWIGDYTSGETFEEFAEGAEGIERIGILRADVDNLGNTFVRGFQRDNNDERYVTISRTASLSRQLSLFFKYCINQILRDGHSCYLCRKGHARKVTIVYSGGDDVFLAGAWNDVIDAFIDLKNALRKFTQNTLSISGGIGIYQSGYPINIMANEVARLEDLSKGTDGKNAITLFDETGTYPWESFQKNIMEDKFTEIKKFFEITDGYGKAFLYHILELLRQKNSKRFNRARYVYFLSRMEPAQGSPLEEIEAYRHFSKKMYQWAGNPQDCRETITAIYLYIYLNRERNEYNEADRS